MTGMRWNWVVGAFALLVLAVLVYAWIDGGRQPVKPIRQPIPIPGAIK